MARFNFAGAPGARLAAAARLPQRVRPALGVPREAAAVATTGTAVRDSAHLGDIHGAFGTVRAGALDRPAGWGQRIRYLLAIMGPGLNVMVGDNDAGGVATYAQAGQDYGTRLLWVLLLLMQVLAGVLLPSATVFLVLLCNDRAVLGPWVNRPWLNAVAGLIVGVLVLLSLVLTVATLFPHLTGGQLAALLAGGVAVGVLAVAGWAGLRLVPRRVARRGLPDDPEAELDTGVVLAAERLTWRMPPLESLPRPAWSPGRKLGLLTLRLYLVIAISLVIVKIVQLALAPERRGQVSRRSAGRGGRRSLPANSPGWPAPPRCRCPAPAVGRGWRPGCG
jgi:hypothetical protein